MASHPSPEAKKQPLTLTVGRMNEMRPADYFMMI